MEYSIPCCHKIYKKLIDSSSFSKWDVYPRWRLRETTSQDPYRQILDLKIARAFCSRPRNTVDVVPSRLAIPNDNKTKEQPRGQPAGQPPPGRQRRQLPGSRNKTTATRTRSGQSSSQPNLSQRQTRSQAVLGTGKTTSLRMSGRQLQPSIRRR
ncbi:hypothetical protein CMUS01_12633 [Colletotrichum musicola]|uniref:Uncharacterized protein n=1 Tax=Colletotrichum musicola TaxID=2175873 RepID=A0A8H6JKU8_9PEZI|nr:hypothetical protein CMUS01_12633 [Colletotrichum musicola]